MSLEQAYFIAEILAASAVVISLLYLGVQIRASRIQAQTEAVDHITKQRADFVRVMAEHNELSHILPKAFAGKRRLHPNEHFRFTSYMYYVFVNLELGFKKWKRKEIDEELWERYEEGIHWWMTSPGIRKWWKHNLALGYNQEFNDYVNKMIERISEEDLSIYDKQILFMDAAGDKP